MNTVIRTKSPFAILALLSGTVVLAAIVGVKSGAMTPLAAKVVLGVAIPIFFGAFLWCDPAWSEGGASRGLINKVGAAPA